MNIDVWLQAAVADARRWGLPEVEPLLEALARATKQLRATDFDGPLAHEFTSRERWPKRASD